MNPIRVGVPFIYFWQAESTVWDFTVDGKSYKHLLAGVPDYNMKVEFTISLLENQAKQLAREASEYVNYASSRFDYTRQLLTSVFDGKRVQLEYTDSDYKFHCWMICHAKATVLPRSDNWQIRSADPVKIHLCER